MARRAWLRRYGGSPKGQRANMQGDRRPKNDLEFLLPIFVPQKMLGGKGARPAAAQRKQV